MSKDETYNGWANRETWAVALHINNDQGWQESVHEVVRNTRDGIAQDPPAFLEPEDLTDRYYAARAGDAIRANVMDELTLDDAAWEEADVDIARQVVNVLSDIGSLWRVDWTELGAAFLSDLEDDASS